MSTNAQPPRPGEIVRGTGGGGTSIPPLRTCDLHDDCDAADTASQDARGRTAMHCRAGVAVQSRLDWIMTFVSAYGSTDGAHHKQWLIDQIARIALGAPVTVVDGFATVGTCTAYEQWADGWDPGVAP